MAEREIVTLEDNHPVAVALRRQMKGDFIDAVSHLPAPEWTWGENARLVLFGSTLMHQLHYIDKIDFPFMGARVSDIDIAVWLKDGKYGEWDRGLHHDFRGQFLSHVPQLLKQATLNAHFNYSREEGRHGPLTEKWDRKELESLPAGEYFSKTFMVYRVFNGADAMHRLSFRRDAGKLKDLMRADPRLWDKEHDCFRPDVDIKVSLTISPHAAPFRMILEPETLYPGSDDPVHNRIPVYRTHRLDVLAQKIARIMANPQKEKAGDFLDIYNFCNAKPPIINLDDASPTGDLNKLRLLIVNYLPDRGCGRLTPSIPIYLRPLSPRRKTKSPSCASSTTKYPRTAWSTSSPRPRKFWIPHAGWWCAFSIKGPASPTGR